MADHEDAALVFFKGALQLFFGVHIEVVGLNALARILSIVMPAVRWAC